MDQSLGPRVRLERRAARRVAARYLPLALTVRLRPAVPVVLLDISPRGVLVESPCRCGPGTRVALQVTSRDRSWVLQGRIVRSAVVRLAPSGPVFRSAIAFDDFCDLFGVVKAQAG
ncbi:MAG: hypothetical protein HYX76_10785 [Acidobacteria bacterium]|nr:hypothetical protein [Acidobacteriota bacterium]